MYIDYSTRCTRYYMEYSFGPKHKNALHLTVVQRELEYMNNEVHSLVHGIKNNPIDSTSNTGQHSPNRLDQ